ncbi:MAG: LamG domain-containing protein [Minisyncoccia bacterium]
MRNKKKIIIISILLSLAGATGVFVYGFFGGGVSGPSAAPNLAEHGLVGYWNMEEGKGQTISDRSGNGNNGTLGADSSVGKDDPVFTSGYSSSGPGGTGLKFDGKDDYVTSASNIDITTAFTFSAWVKNSTVANSLVGIFNYGPTNGYGGNIAINTRSYTGGLVTTVLNAGGITLNTDWGVFSSYIDHHLAVTYDNTLPSNNLKIYIDNILKAQANYTVSIINTNKNIRIGYAAANWYYMFHNGSLDDLRVYNRALSADEIRQLYNQKKPILEWKFDEGSGTTVHDEGFNNNDGTLH